MAPMKPKQWKKLKQIKEIQHIIGLGKIGVKLEGKTINGNLGKINLKKYILNFYRSNRVRVVSAANHSSHYFHQLLSIKKYLWLLSDKRDYISTQD